MSLASLVIRASQVLGLTQEELGRILGQSRRTVQRWTDAGDFPLVQTQAQALVQALHPHDPGLARQIAEAAGYSLPALGILPSTPAVVPRAPTPAHLVDSVLCAASEAMGLLPAAVRPMVDAAFDRAWEMGLSVETVRGALREPAQAATKVEGKAKRRG